MQWFKKFIPCLSKRSYNLRQLTRTGVPFRFTKEHQAEVDDLVSCLKNPPVLTPIMANKPVWIFTDGSMSGLGFLVCQAHDIKGQGHEPTEEQILSSLRRGHTILKPCSYGSKSYTEAMTRWTAASLEISAAILGLQSVMPYIKTNKVYLITDNCSVVHLRKLKLGSNRDRRSI